VFADRYHARQLKTPGQVRNALRYVLLNYRLHKRRQAAASPVLASNQGAMETSPLLQPLAKGGRKQGRSSDGGAARKEAIGPRWFDPCSSAAFFQGFKEPLPWREPWMREAKLQGAVTAKAKTWLLTKGWARGGGQLSLNE
jgi:hypothetical protein